MYEKASKKNKELSITRNVDSCMLTKTEKLKLYSQCKKNIRQNFDVVNLGMLIFFNCLSKYEKNYKQDYKKTVKVLIDFNNHKKNY